MIDYTDFMATYYSSLSRPGTLKYRYGAPWSAVGFTFSPKSIKSDGVAFTAGSDEKGNQLWRLTIGKDELPGRFLLVDGVFVPA